MNRIFCLLLSISILVLCSCSYKSELKIKTVVYEAEDSTLIGETKVESSGTNYSGSGYVTQFENENDGCEFCIEIKKDNFYDLNFVSKAIGGKKENYVYVDGQNIGTIKTVKESFSDSIFSRVFLECGNHSIKVMKSWGWICLDYLEISESNSIDKGVYKVEAKLINKNASDNTKRLMSYMCDIYGDSFLSGQYCDSGMYGNEIACLLKVNGRKFPAVLGLDFIDYSLSRVQSGAESYATEYAKEFWDKGGIVTFCWHWNAPKKYITGDVWQGFYTKNTNIDLEKIINGKDTDGYNLLLDDIDAIAQQLKFLDNYGVPILWRPLHEASGGWFWWGDAGADAYKKLWVLLFDKLTNEYELNNLIWVWNGQNKDWYPGDEYVDIIGEDIYPGEKVYSSQINKYLEACNYTNSNKMIVLSENGCLFDPDLAIRDGAMWGFFATWQREFVSKGKAFINYSDQYTEESMVKKVYNHEKVVTLDELPDLKNYKIRKDAN